jgi:hypothetical protein
MTGRPLDSASQLSDWRGIRQEKAVGVSNDMSMLQARARVRHASIRMLACAAYRVLKGGNAWAWT